MSDHSKVAKNILDMDAIKSLSFNNIYFCDMNFFYLVRLFDIKSTIQLSQTKISTDIKQQTKIVLRGFMRHKSSVF